MENNLEAKIVQRGQSLFKSIAGQVPSVFDQGFWSGKVLDWAMDHEDFRVQLFRFVDVLPALSTTESLQSHIEDYFARTGSAVPAVLRWGAGKAGKASELTGKLIGKAVRSNVEAMAKGFIIGRTSQEAAKSLTRLRSKGFAFTVDFMGEATLSEKEADHHLAGYLELLEELGRQQESWPALNSESDLDWGDSPKINLAVKPSAFFSQANPAAPRRSVQGMLARIKPMYQRIVELGGSLCLDMEQYRYKDITLELFKRLRNDPDFTDYPFLAVALQVYLRDADKNLENLLTWVRAHKLPVIIRLVKGAYWDYETAHALQNGWTPPVWAHKPESDLAFERLAQKVLENHDLCYLSAASHNIRSLAMVLETAQALGVPDNRLEIQMLYGMAEPVAKTLLAETGRVRLYCPYGELLPGMSYLVRRLLENTANESFLRQSFSEGVERERLLQNPALALELEKSGHKPKEQPGGPGGLPAFSNHPLLDYTDSTAREEFAQALTRVRGQLGQTHPLIINGYEVSTESMMTSLNPADPDEVVGRFCLAGKGELNQALAAAQEAFPAWRDTPPLERAELILRAADQARQAIYDLAAWQALEVGKQWDQAYADVAEAIDFMEYYAREALKLAEPKRLGRKPGELNHFGLQPRGVTAVIAPWNFPLAISCGMSSAAIVTGNPVVYKPASLSPMIGLTLARLFMAAGLPAGVFNFCPASGEQVGDYLVTDPRVATIAFTGSEEVGLRIMRQASTCQLGHAGPKRVIAEMGGKNAVIVDEDADLDEAVAGVMSSAFGFQGQKCSACSRVIVLEAVYQRFVDRLVEAARSVNIGPAEDPANFMGPVVDQTQRRKVLEYLELARQEGEILLEREVPLKGCYVPLSIVGGIKKEHRLAQEEIFGPILAVMKAADFEEALAIANSTRQALTGGVFSRSPRNLERATREFRVGNLYLNRGITGSMVGRQPFGGHGASGLGAKAGGPHYLPQFMNEVCLTENTMRRGFIPLAADDEWVD